MPNPAIAQASETKRPRLWSTLHHYSDRRPITNLSSSFAQGGSRGLNRLNQSRPMDGQRESLFHATAPGVSDRLPKKRILDKSRDDLKPLLARRRQIAVHSVVDDVTVDPDRAAHGWNPERHVLKRLESTFALSESIVGERHDADIEGRR